MPAQRVGKFCAQSCVFYKIEINGKRKTHKVILLRFIVARS